MKDVENFSEDKSGVLLATNEEYYLRSDQTCPVYQVLKVSTSSLVGLLSPLPILNIFGLKSQWISLTDYYPTPRAKLQYWQWWKDCPSMHTFFLLHILIRLQQSCKLSLTRSSNFRVYLRRLCVTEVIYSLVISGKNFLDYKGHHLISAYLTNHRQMAKPKWLIECCRCTSIVFQWADQRTRSNGWCG